MVIINTYLITD